MVVEVLKKWSGGTGGDLKKEGTTEIVDGWERIVGSLLPRWDRIYRGDVSVHP